MAILDIVIRARNQASGPVGEVQTSIDGLKRAAADAVNRGLSPLKIALGNLAANYAAQAVNGLASGIRSLFGDVIHTASDIEEMTSAFNVAFGASAEGTRAELARLADEMKRAPTEFMRYGVAFQNIFVPLGYGRAEAAKLSTTLTTLTSDLASFHNVAEADVLLNLRSGLVGEHEALRKYGIVITETSLKQELMTMGSHELTGAALEQAKVQARLNIIMRSTVDAQGDAIRTAGSFANSMRGLQAVLLDVRAGIGEKLLPAVTPFIQALTEFIREVGPKFVEWFGTVLEAVQQWAIDVGLQEKLQAAGQWIAGFGDTLKILKQVFMEAAGQGVVFEDTLAQLDPALASIVRPIANLVVMIRDLALWVWDVTKPLREWIAQNVTLGDVLVALGGWLVWLGAGPLAGLLVNLATVAAAFGASVLVVTLLRKAWETDFLGIRSAFDGVVNHFKMMWGVLVQAFQEHGAGALAEIVAFVTTGKAEFTQLGLLLDDIGFIFRNTWQKLLEFIRTKATEISQAIAATGDGTLQLLGQRLVLIVRYIFETLNSFFELIGQLWKTATSQDVNVVTAAWNAIKTVVTTVLDVLTYDIVEFLQALSLTFKAATLVLQGDWEGAWELITVAFRSVGEALQYTWDHTLKRLVGYLAEHWPAWSVKLGEWAGAAWEWLRDTVIPNTITQLGNWWNSFRDWMAEHGPTWANNLLEWAENTWVWLRDVVIPNTVTQLKDWWAGFNDWMTEHGLTWESNFGDWAGAAWEWLRDEVIPNTITHIRDWWKNFRDWFTEHWPEWKQNWADWSKTAWEWLRDEVLPEIKKHLGLISDAFWAQDGPGGKLSNWLRKHFPDSTRTAGEAWQELGGIFGEVVDEFAQAFAKLRDNAEENGFSIFRTLDAVFTIMTVRVTTLLGQMLLGVKAGLQVLQGDWQGAWDSLSRISEMSSEATAREFVAGWTILEQNSRLWGGKTSEGYAAGIAEGEDAIERASGGFGTRSAEGFGKGLTEGQSKAKKSVADFGGLMTEEMKNALDIHSPSGVFERIGDLTGAGFLGGLKGVLSLTALRGVGTDVLRGLSDGVTYWPEVQRVLENMKELAKRALQALRDAFGIHSPSAETFAMMQWLVEGAVLGAEQYGGALADALGAMGAGAVAELRQTIAAGEPAIQDTVAAMQQRALAAVQTTRDLVGGQLEALVGQVKTETASAELNLKTAQMKLEALLGLQAGALGTLPPGSGGAGSGTRSGQPATMQDAAAALAAMPTALVTSGSAEYQALANALTAQMKERAVQALAAAKDAVTPGKIQSIIDQSGFLGLISRLQGMITGWLEMENEERPGPRIARTPLSANPAIETAARLFIEWMKGGAVPTAGGGTQWILNMTQTGSNQMTADVLRAIQTLAALYG